MSLNEYSTFSIVLLLINHITNSFISHVALLNCNCVDVGGEAGGRFVREISFLGLLMRL